MTNHPPIVDTFLRLVQIDSPTGHEQQLAETLCQMLRDLGAEVRTDAAGNVIATLDGEGDPILLSAHMDTVEPGRGSQAAHLPMASSPATAPPSWAAIASRASRSSWTCCGV